MRLHRTIISIAALIAVLALPTSGALANSLLSGYGGPGAGNQAILGSTLLEGPKGGRGGSNGSSGPPVTSLAAPTGTAAPVPSGAASGGGGEAARGATGGAVGRTGRGGSAQGAAPVRRAHTTASLYPTAERIPVGAGDSLGLSGADIVYLVCGAAVLALLALLLVRVARSAPQKQSR